MWIAFIGWFLDHAAAMQVLQVEFQGALAGHKVAQAMSRSPPSVSAETTLQELVDKHILGSGRRSFTVTDGDRLVGLMTLHRVKEVPRERWSVTTAAQIAKPLDQLKRLEPDTELWTAMQEMDRDGVNQLPVVEHGKIVGMLSRDDLISFLRTLRELGA